MPVCDRGVTQHSGPLLALSPQGVWAVECISTTRGQQRHEKFTGSSKLSSSAFLLVQFPETLNSISSRSFLPPRAQLRAST